MMPTSRKVNMHESNSFDWTTLPTKDEIHFLKNTPRWKTSTPIIDDFHNYIKQHTLFYYSSFNSIFLMMLRDVSSLSFFDKVFVRDGSLALKLFFLRNPSPQELKTKLIIHSSSASIVPETWKKNIFYFDYHFKNTKRLKNKNLIITYHPDAFHCPDEFFEASLRSLANLDEYESLYFLITDPQTFHFSGFVNEASFQKAALSQKVLKRKMKLLNLYDLSPKTMAASDFLEVNPFNYLFTDCYLRWHLLYHGAYPLDQRWLKGASSPLHEVLISPQHSVVIHKSVETSLQLGLGVNEEVIFSEDKDGSYEHHVNLCSDGFKKYVFSLVVENAKINN